MPPFADAPRVPVTERVSPHALDMESRGAEGVLEALAACDAEMWAEAHADDDGTRDASSHPGLIHPTVVADIARLALAVSRCVARDTPETPAAVLVVGCGTSGRLAFQCARAAELSSRHEKGGVRGRKRKRAVFRHVLAGGDAALFQSAESCEDDRERGASDFRRAVAAYEPHPLKSLVVVGVSCGLSAPYVSSFLAEAGRFGARAPEGKDALTVARFALGFNPRRDAPERGGFRELFPSFAETRSEPGPARVASETFALASENFDVSADGPSGRDARRDEDVVFVNPVLGPELVAGSSRLKGGSATKIILDAAFAVAEVMRGAGIGTASLENTRNTRPADDRTAAALTSRALSAFEAATRRAHSRLVSRDACGAASACASAAGAVAAGGDVSLVSVAEFAEIAESVRVDESPSGASDGVTTELRTVAGVTVAALVDASEQRPTFGTPAEKYRAFGGGGWNALFGKSGSATNDRDGVEATFRDGDFPRGRFDVSWDAYVRDAETKKHPSVGDDANDVSVSNTAKRKETAETKTKTPKTPKTFLLVLFTPADGARAARQRRAARLAMALERAKHPDGEGVRRASFAFLCVRADAREPKTPPWEVDATDGNEGNALGGAESGLASAFGADAVFVDLVSRDALETLETRSRDRKRKRFDVSRSSALETSLHEALLARLAPRAAELGAKVALNAISVAAHALCGKTFAGRMIDVRVSNVKLYHRAARVVAAAAGTDVEAARDAIARACGVEPVKKKQTRKTRDADGTSTLQRTYRERSHLTAVIARASTLSSVVPIAALLARGACDTVEEARNALAKNGNDARATLFKGGLKGFKGV